MLGHIVLLIILLGLSGFFSGAEVALVSLSRSKVRYMVESGRVGAKYIKKLKDDNHRMLSAILIGNNVVNVAASAITTAVMLDYFESYAISIATGVMTFLILIFGEITPKAFANHRNELVSQIVAAPIWFLSVILSPIVSFTSMVAKLTFRIFGVDARRNNITEEDIRSMVTVAEEDGEILEMEKKMINNIFEFDDISAEEIATPRIDMITISSDATLSDALLLIAKHKFSRIPVHQGHRDNIVGILYLKDLIRFRKEGSKKVTDIMKKPYFVPEAKKISSLLKQFQKRKEQMAIVVDEHGAVTGIVTLEDVLEEIVGEIMDETDKFAPNIQEIDEDKWLVDGKTDIDDLNEQLKMQMDGEEYDTLGGFILDSTGKIPHEGDEIKHNGYILTVIKKDGNRITKVSVEKKKLKTEEKQGKSVPPSSH